MGFPTSELLYYLKKNYSKSMVIRHINRVHVDTGTGNSYADITEYPISHGILVASNVSTIVANALRSQNYPYGDRVGQQENRVLIDKRDLITYEEDGSQVEFELNVEDEVLFDGQIHRIVGMVDIYDSEFQAVELLVQRVQDSEAEITNE